MKKKLIKVAKRHLKEIRQRHDWQKVVFTLACVVVFCTTYAMILPAITLEKNSCGLEEHSHGESCYEKVLSKTVQTLACGYDSEDAHVHAAECFDAEGNPTCGKTEESVHIHDEEACYVTEEVPADDADLLTCPLSEGHVHAENCCDEAGILICEETENHIHGDMCYGTWVLACGQEEHTHTDQCRETEELRGELETVVTEPADPGEQIAPMAELPRECVEEPKLIDGSNVTWAVYKKGSDEYVLRFDGEGAIPDFSSTQGKPWAAYINSKIKVHLEFGENVTVLGVHSLTSINIASIEWGGIREIKSNSLSYGSGPEVLEIPGTVKIIRASAFGNRNVGTIVLHEGIETLMGSAFFCNVSSDAPIHIPASATEIKGTLNIFCTGYTVSEDNPNYCAVDGVLFTKDMKTLKEYPKDKIGDTYRVPDGVETIESSAFLYVQLDKLILSPSVKSIGDRIAQTGRIGEVYIEDGSQLSKAGSALFIAGYGVTNIRYPENTAIPLVSFFRSASGSSLDGITRFTVPNKITSIGLMEGELRNLERVTYNAENAQITTEKLFNSCAAYDLYIDTEVNHLPKNFFCFVAPAGAVYFRGENTFTVESGAFASAGEPLETLSGTFHTDANGVLYRCLEDGTARIVYASGDVPEDLTIPATVHTDDGAVYTVTAVGTHAFRTAEELTGLTFEAPEQITDLAPLAMANCPTLQRVNGETVKEAAEATFPNAPEKTKVFYNTSLDRPEGDRDGDGILDGTGQENLTVQREGATDMNINFRTAGGTQQWVEKENGTGLYQLLTGDTVTVTTSVGNTEGNEDYIYRIYFRKTREDCILSILPGNSFTFDGQTAVCYGTEDPNTIYLEFWPTVGATVNIPVTAVYSSPDSPGGGVEIWGVILSRQEAEASANAVVTGTQLVQAQWTTRPDGFTLTQTSGAARNIIGNGSGIGMPDSNLTWKVTLTRGTETTSAYGKDYGESVVFTDIIILPEGFSWNPELVAALQSGPVPTKITASKDNNLIIGGVDMAKITRGSDGTLIKGIEAYWDTERDTVAFRWEIHNNGNEAEMNGGTVTVALCPDALIIDMNQVNPTVAYLIRNDVTAEVHYRYSDPVPLSAFADHTIKGGAASINLKKTSSGAKYFGEDITYTIDLYNKGALPFAGQEGYVYRLEEDLGSYNYIKPENMEAMFRLYGSDLTVKITKAVLAPWQSVTGADGTQVWRNAGNSDLGTPDHSLVISLGEEGGYLVTVDGTAEYRADTVAEALQQAGYAVTGSATYTCIWQLHGPETVFTLENGVNRYFYVYATAKDSFRVITKDWPGSYPSEETLTVTATTRVYHSKSTIQQAYAAVSDYLKREAYVEEAVYKGEVEQIDCSSISNGDVLTYHLDFYHYGTGSYENLPMVDDLYGSQYLLVPAEENPQLAGLDTHEDQGVVYYILKVEDSDDPNHVTVYENVTVGVDDEGNSLVAETVTVGRATDEVQLELGGNTVTYAGIHTEIKWYFPEISGEYWMQVRYNTLADMSLEGAAYTIGNVVWMNDRRDTRIYDIIWDGGTIIEFEKEIVTEKGDTYAADVTEKYSLVPRGGEILYRLTLHNTDDAPFTLKCENLADGLPENFGIFLWDKTNVALTGIETDSETLEYTGLDQWDIADSFGGMAGENRQYIVWPEGTEIRFKDNSTIYLYFTLTYPDNGDTELWNQYAAAVSGNRIFNTLYVYKFASSVEHDLYEPGKILLQKGVSGLYHYLTLGGGGDYYRPAGNSRAFYSNRDARSRAVMYYVTVYNGGNKRLYLEDLYDRVPKGFSFNQLIKGSPFGYIGGALDTNIVTDGGILPDGNGITNFAGGSVVYRSATITPKRTDYGVIFQISAGKGDYTLRYDEVRGKYYLNSGEAIAFTYTCDIGEMAKTEDLATNTIAMAYDDYLGTGLTTVPVSELAVSAVNIEPFQDNNDGTRLVKSDQEVVDQYGFPSGGETQWLVSDVTLERGRIRPGVTKYTDAYTPEGGNRQEYRYAVVPTATVHWRVRLHNSGTMVLWDYTFTDVMPKPYVFEGDIVFQCYDINDHMYYEQALGTISQRSPGDTSLTFVKTDGTKITVPLDGTQVKVGTNRLLSIEKDETGNEVLRIECKAGDPSIQEGGYMDVTLSSRNPTNDHTNTVYTNRATLHPKTQQFDNVSQGSMLRDEQGAPVGAENYSPVNVSFGYATRSEKRVTEDARPENTAVSVDMDKNRIYLGSAEGTFTYQLTVGNDTEIPMTKLVIIDNLPEAGDHTPFDSSVSRGSAFTVHFAEDPDFTVRITGKEGEQTVLTPDQYTLEFSDSTDFGGPQSSDWNGADTGKWYGQPTAASRSLRLIILDDSGTLIPHESQIDITFRAKADSGAEAGMIAWNSFGYHYGLQGISGELEAMPLVVGVAVPDVPALKKQIVSADSDVPAKVQVRSEFRFLIYEGAALSGTYTSAEELRAALDAAGRPDDAVAEVTVPVDAGQAESAELPLESMPWKWIHGNKYTVSEIPSGDKFSFYRFEGGHNTQYTFTYDTGYTQTVVCKNRLEEWSIRITKTDPEGRLLAGAVFGLYSPSAENAMSQEEAALWDAPLTAEVETEEGKQIWYLQKVAETGKDGVVQWGNLLEERYYLLEIHAPDGHNLPEKNGWMLERSESESGVLDVQGINEPGYELPETGGMGTTMFYVFGGIMMLAAFALLVTRKRMADSL